MRRLCLCVLLLTLAACQVAPPIEPIPTATIAVSELPPATTSAVAASPSPDASDAAYLPSLNTGYPPPPTNTALPPTPSPTITLTPQPTTTPLPTPTATIAGTLVPLPVITIDRPLPNEFVGATIPVAGSIARATDGTVLLSVRSPDGQPVGPDPVSATVSAANDGLRFDGQIRLELPPTPRLAQTYVEWTADADPQRSVDASQPINLEGRYPRVDRLIVETPQPFMRPAADLVVGGVAPGPPAKLVVRLLDDADQVLESVEAELGWYQPGLACTFDATLPNNPAATQVQVISLGPDEAVIEAARVRLEPRG